MRGHIRTITAYTLICLTLYNGIDATRNHAKVISVDLKNARYRIEIERSFSQDLANQYCEMVENERGAHEGIPIRYARAYGRMNWFQAAWHKSFDAVWNACSELKETYNEWNQDAGMKSMSRAVQYSHFTSNIKIFRNGELLSIPSECARDTWRWIRMGDFDGFLSVVPVWLEKDYDPNWVGVIDSDDCELLFVQPYVYVVKNGEIVEWRGGSGGFDQKRE